MTDEEVMALLTELRIVGTFKSTKGCEHEGTQWVRLEGYIIPALFESLVEAMGDGTVNRTTA